MHTNTCTRALALVRRLLEEDLMVSVTQWGETFMVPAVVIKPPSQWRIYTWKRHGEERLYRIDKVDQEDYSRAIDQLEANYTKVLVPREGKWALKVAPACAVLGGDAAADEGGSIANKYEKLHDDIQIVENPLMDEWEKHVWERNRRGL